LLKQVTIMHYRTSFFVAALLLGGSLLPAAAQINPFRGNRAQTMLSATDLQLMGDSITKLNKTPDLQVGSSDQWSNPATGSHGTSSVTRIFTSGGLQCHAMHHDFFAEGKEPSRGYDATWCRTPKGQWKMKS
jgi:surface antigen